MAAPPRGLKRNFNTCEALTRLYTHFTWVRVFHLFSAIRIYLSQICLPLFQERKGNIFLRPVIIGQKPYKPFLLLTPGHDYPLTRMSGKHLGIIKYRRQVLKPFYFRFSSISRRFIVPEKGSATDCKIPAKPPTDEHGCSSGVCRNNRWYNPLLH